MAEPEINKNLRSSPLYDVTVNEKVFNFNSSLSPIIMGHLGEIGWYAKFELVTDTKE
jgi:hypothetical protein